MKVETITGRNDEAIMNFEKVNKDASGVNVRESFFYSTITSRYLILQVRYIDPFVVTYMDEYALLLKLKSDHSKLNKLVHDLLLPCPSCEKGMMIEELYLMPKRLSFLKF